MDLSPSDVSYTTDPLSLPPQGDHRFDHCRAKLMLHRKRADSGEKLLESQCQGLTPRHFDPNSHLD
jgi:hypothetical protein